MIPYYLYIALYTDLNDLEENEMHTNQLDNKKHYLIIAIIIIIIASVLVYNGRHNKYVNINNLVSKAYTSSTGYNADMAKYMSKDVYNKANGYIIFKDYDCKRPIKFSLRLTEINQHKINGKVFVHMVYGLDLIDADGISVVSSRNIPVVFTVTGTNDNLYIEKVQEYEGVNNVPKIYK